MLRCQTKINGSVCTVELGGSVDETTDLAFDIGAATEVHVYCPDLDRVNSTGLKKWLLWFTSLRSKGVTLKFFDLSVFMVNQCNFVTSLVNKDEVESLCVPYFCDNCSSEASERVVIADLRAADYKAKPIQCPTCRQPMELDAVAGTYFKFITP